MIDDRTPWLTRLHCHALPQEVASCRKSCHSTVTKFCRYPTDSCRLSRLVHRHSVSVNMPPRTPSGCTRRTSSGGPESHKPEFRACFRRAGFLFAGVFNTAVVVHRRGDFREFSRPFQHQPVDRQGITERRLWIAATTLSWGQLLSLTLDVVFNRG